MSKHTPPNPLPCGCGAKGTPYLDPIGDKGYEYKDVHVVHCALHAAAPDLLEALKAARQEFDECCADTEGTPTQKHFAELLSRCDATIAKAEGPDPENGTASAAPNPAGQPNKEGEPK